MYRQLPFFPPPTSPLSSFPGFPQGGGQPNQPGFPGQSPSQGGNQNASWTTTISNSR